MTIAGMYRGYRMDSDKSRAALVAIMAAVARLERATSRELAEATGVDQRAVDRYVAYLRLGNHLSTVVKFNRRKAVGGVYAIGPVAFSDDPDEGGDAAPFIQRTVGANDWPRGEHARRSGPLGFFFPLPCLSPRAQEA